MPTARARPAKKLVTETFQELSCPILDEETGDRELQLLCDLVKNPVTDPSDR
jgi:hypothetical protein